MILKKWVRVIRDLKTGEYCAWLCSLEQEAKKEPTGSLELIKAYEIEIEINGGVVPSGNDDAFKKIH